MSREMSSVAQFFDGKSVLVTGGTGFVGKALVEKLLRACPGLQRVYLLVRPRRGQGFKGRFNQYIGSRVFDSIRSQPRLFDKLHLVKGDILEEELGLSEEDRRLLRDDVHVVFHCAAQVRFDSCLRDAIDMNVLGTQRMLDLADTMTALEVFVHLSTAYCRAELAQLEERTYEPPHAPQDVARLVRWLGDDALRHLEPKLVHPQPNTYGYSKALAEGLLPPRAGRYAIALARPSVVTAALREPLPGWVENMNGPTGIIVGAGKGVVRSMLCDASQRVDAMPVDLVVNACILLAYKAAVRRAKDVVVCNMTRSDENPITWGAAIELARAHVAQNPFSVSLWYPGGSPKTNELLHRIAVLLTHLLPAHLIDFYLILAGKKPFLVALHARVEAGMKVLQQYTLRGWRFANDGFLALRRDLSPADDRLFYTDPNAMDWDAYMRDYVLGARHFCCGERPDSLPEARKAHRRLFYMDLALKAALACVLLYSLTALGLRLSNVM